MGAVTEQAVVPEFKLHYQDNHWAGPPAGGVHSTEPQEDPVRVTSTHKGSLMVV